MLEENRKPRIAPQKRFNLVDAPSSAVEIGWHGES
jgi:hypothetical protein